MIKRISIFMLVFVFALDLFAGKAEDIIDKHLEVSGAAKMESVKTQHLKGSMAVMGMSMPFELWVRTPESFRMEMEAMGQKMVSAFDGKEGWMLTNGQTMPLPEQQKQQAKQYYQFSGSVLANYKEDVEEIKLIGREKIDGVDCYKISVKNKKIDSPATIFIGKEDYLIHQLVSSNNGQEIKIALMDYKTIDGVKMPFKVKIMAGAQNMEMVYEKVEFNIKIADSMFAKPKE